MLKDFVLTVMLHVYRFVGIIHAQLSEFSMSGCVLWVHGMCVCAYVVFICMCVCVWVYVISDPRFHYLAGCAGVAQGRGLSQHHALRVTPCPGHLPPLYRFLSHTQSK